MVQHTDLTLKRLGLDPSEEVQEIEKEDTVQEAAFSMQQVVENARESLDFLAALSMPSTFEYFFPPVFLLAWKWVTEYSHKTRDFSKLALGLPRGFGKTTVIKLFILYCILFTKKRFILVCSARQPLAINIIADVLDMLEEANIKKVFGDWKIGIETNNQEIKKFAFRGRTIVLAAAGAEGAIRGFNLKQERPDVIIFEDVQTRENANSDVQSKALEQWMVGTAMKTKSPRGCLFLFVGNMYPTPYSILRKLKANPNWIKFIAGGILSNGTSLWEDLQPLSQLVEEYENDLAMGHPEIFHAEVLNDENAKVNTLVDLEKVPRYPFDLHEPIAGNFIIIDPATDKAKSDAVSIGLFNVFDSIPTLCKIVSERLSPGDTIREAIKLALNNNCRLIAIESNSYQYTLKYWCEFIAAQLQITGIEFVAIYSGMTSKNGRIAQMLKAYLAGEILAHPDVKVQVHHEISQWDILRRDNTDGILDLLTYAPRVMAEFSEYIASLDIIEMQEFNSVEVYAVEDSSYI